MQRTLIIDRSTQAPSAALFEGGAAIACLASETDAAGRSPDWLARLARVIDATAIDAFVVALGPGSFSGIRAALAAAHGMALVRNRPVYGIAAAAALAWRTARESGESIVNVVGDARRGTLWHAAYRIDGDRITLASGAPMTQAATDFSLFTPASAEATLVPGAPIVSADAARLTTLLPAATLCLPQADDFAAIYCANPEACPAEPLPIYLHAAVAGAPR